MELPALRPRPYQLRPRLYLRGRRYSFISLLNPAAKYHCVANCRFSCAGDTLSRGEVDGGNSLSEARCSFLSRTPRRLRPFSWRILPTRRKFLSRCRTAVRSFFKSTPLECKEVRWEPLIPSCKKQKQMLLLSVQALSSSRESNEYDLEMEIFRFMERSKSPETFPSKGQLQQSGRQDLVDAILATGGWLTIGWDTDTDAPLATAASRNTSRPRASSPVSREPGAEPGYPREWISADGGKLADDPVAPRDSAQVQLNSAQERQTGRDDLPRGEPLEAREQRRETSKQFRAEEFDSVATGWSRMLQGIRAPPGPRTSENSSLDGQRRLFAGKDTQGTEVTTAGTGDTPTSPGKTSNRTGGRDGEASNKSFLDKKDLEERRDPSAAESSSEQPTAGRQDTDRMVRAQGNWQEVAKLLGLKEGPKGTPRGRVQGRGQLSNVPHPKESKGPGLTGVAAEAAPIVDGWEAAPREVIDFRLRKNSTWRPVRATSSARNEDAAPLVPPTPTGAEGVSDEKRRRRRRRRKPDQLPASAQQSVQPDATLPGISPLQDMSLREQPGADSNGSADVSESVLVRIRALEATLEATRAALQSGREALRCSRAEFCQVRDSTVAELLEVADSLEHREDDIIRTRNQLRNTRAEVTAMEGQLAADIRTAQMAIEEREDLAIDADLVLSQLRPTRIVWPNHGSEVLLAGSFDGWTNRIKLEVSNAGVFATTLHLNPGRYEIKFVVDGCWRVDPRRKISYSGGNENNVLIVP